MIQLPRMSLLRVAATAVLIALAGCASLPQSGGDALQREAMAGTQRPVPAPLPLNTDIAPASSASSGPQISTGTGRFYRPTAMPTPRPTPTGANAVTFNFENQPVQAVVKTILGDLLKVNYTIVPGVEGNISFATAQPVNASQALPILEMLLSWTGNAVVKQGTGYVVMKAKDAVGGSLVPGLGAAAPDNGLQARLFPLHYISATEMQKLIKPFARPDSILLVDAARNLLVMAGTPQELANYARTVRTFDVDWLRGMSVGVFSLEHANVTELMPKLETLFGKGGDTPLAGMLRFIPIERTNALVVISTQPDYLNEVGSWIHRIDSGGNEPQLYIYDVRNIKASDLARYLGQIYGRGNGNDSSSGAGGEVGPGLTGTTLGTGNASGMGSGAGGFGSTGFNNGSSLNNGAGGTSGGGGLGSTGGGLGSVSGGPGGSGGFGQNGSGQASGAGGAFAGGGMAGGNGPGSESGQRGGHEYTSSDGSIRISAVDDNNQLLVRARPAQWQEIEDAIKRLDTVPLQVQIETKIMEVTLTNQFQFGVQWYLDGLTGSTSSTDSSGNTTVVPGQPYRHRQIALGSGGNTYSPSDTLFYSFINSKMQVALSAMETSGNTKTLSAPSMVVLNNQQASIQVGDQIPINTTYYSGLGSTNSVTSGSVQYVNTGVILNVIPRVNPGGLVYLNINQQVSNPGVTNAQGNFTISSRQLSTQVAVQSGQTVLLGGLIQQNDQNTDTGIPGLNRIPYLGRLFGTTNRSKNRTELIVLITPRVIRSSEDARAVIEEYQRKFESLAPLREQKAGATTVPLRPVPPPSAAVPASQAALTQDWAEKALARRDYATAEDMAMQSWRNGTDQGPLCRRNWLTIALARKGRGDSVGAAAARKHEVACRAPS